MYDLDEETNEVKLAEEQPDMGTDALKSLEAWCHYKPIIHDGGMCKKQVDPNAAEEDAGDGAEEIPPFRILTEDQAMDKVPGAWISRVSGDTQQYKTEAGAFSYAVNVIRSLRWPGALTVSKGGEYCCLYVGDGLKKGDPSFNPTEPPEVMSDPIGQGEEPEPTP